MLISPLCQKQAYCLENQTVVAGMQRERDKVQFLTSKLASYLRNNSQHQETAEHAQSPVPGGSVGDKPRLTGYWCHLSKLNLCMVQGSLISSSCQCWMSVLSKTAWTCSGDACAQRLCWQLFEWSHVDCLSTLFFPTPFPFSIVQDHCKSNAPKQNAVGNAIPRANVVNREFMMHYLGEIKQWWNPPKLYYKDLHIIR